MAKVRIEREWRLWLTLGVMAGLLVAYLWWVSRPPTEGGEPLWMVTKVLDPRTISVKGSGATMQIRLIGLTIPPSQEQAVQEFLTKTLTDQWVRIKIFRDATQGPKEGLVLLSGEDMVASLIRKGMAQTDRTETSLDVRPYLELEQEAKKEKRGIWR